jgi:squalene synthase HpnC
VVDAAIPRALAPSYAECARLAREHAENFPVASWLLPSTMRPHVAAVYAFARIADDFADEPGRTPEERLHLLDSWHEMLHDTQPSHPVFLAVSHTRHAFALPVGLFDDLLSAFRQDVTTTRYERWSDVLDYCRRSANPVGRLVLRLAGHTDESLDCRSDAVCTALQLTNFWQDLAIDWERGRLYVPQEIWASHHAAVKDLDAGRLSPAWTAALREAGHRTAELFSEGRGIADSVKGRLRYELRATWLGGRRILDKLEQAEYDVFAHRPRLRMGDALVIGWRTLRWRATHLSTTRS